MAIGSALLKHYTIAKLTNSHPPLRWSQTKISGNKFKKPVYIDPATGRQPVVFNVSHQNGLVVIVAVGGYGHQDGNSQGEEEVVQVGVDIVSPAERRDRDMARAQTTAGWHGFIDDFVTVCSPREIAYLKHYVPTPAAVAAILGGDGPRAGTEAEQKADAKLRVFYTLWALREAFLKMTGEALAAEWMQELRFVEVRPPQPGREMQGEREEEGEEERGEVIRNIDVRFKGQRIEDVNICLRSMGPDFMIATAVRTAGKKEDALGWRLGAYEKLSLEEVLDFAESRR